MTAADLASALLAALVADGDGHTLDQPAYEPLRSQFEVTPKGHLVSAHRTAL